MNAGAAAARAFREAMLNADPQMGGRTNDWDAFSRWESRLSRYDLFWGMFQNNAYQDLIHPGLASQYKARFGLYKHIRQIYSPAYRLGSFYGARLMGGSLDPEAGDGRTAPSALPIETKNKALRPAAARLFQDSRWGTNKDVFCTLGAVCGDVGLKAVDDTRRGRVYLRVVHAGHLKWVDRDPFGHVKGYILQEWRADPRVNLKNVAVLTDPRATQREVIYSEEVFRDGDDVVYRTYLNGGLHDWRDYEAGETPVGPEWREPYGFVPLWLAGHEPSGLPWSFNCFHAGLSRFREVDDQASGLSDQIRKAIRAPKIIAGATPAEIKAAFPPHDPRNPEPDREQVQYIGAPADVRPYDLTFPLDITGVRAHIDDLNQEIEKMYPELLADTGSMTGRVTAESIRQARTLAAAKVQARRSSYDECLAAAMQGAIAIGGFRGVHPDYAAFDLDSFAAGTLDLRIGHRPVFEVDPQDEREADIAEAQALQALVKATVPLEEAMRQTGWPEADIQRTMAIKAQEQADALDQIRQAQILAMSDVPNETDTEKDA